MNSDPSDTPQEPANADAPIIPSQPEGQPKDVAAIRASISSFLNQKDESGKVIGSVKCGVYAFYDYDGEPIYIGQTYEGLRSRIGRHLTNQRTDAVAMNVLDPFEVAEIEVWPLDFHGLPQEEKKRQLNQAEYTLYLRVIEQSSFKAVLNEKKPTPMDTVELPPSHRGRIIPDDIFPERKHPDVRIARRAATIAALARVISERKVTTSLRTTLLTQARRLERLAAQRLGDFAPDLEGADFIDDGD